MEEQGLQQAGTPLRSLHVALHAVLQISAMVKSPCRWCISIDRYWAGSYWGCTGSHFDMAMFIIIQI